MYAGNFLSALDFALVGADMLHGSQWAHQTLPAAAVHALRLLFHVFCDPTTHVFFFVDATIHALLIRDD